MPHTGRLAARYRRHAPLYGRHRTSRGPAPGDFVPLARPARRAGARTAGFVALGVFAALVTAGIVLAFLTRVVRPG